jgi:hypothetical protein
VTFVAQPPSRRAVLKRNVPAINSFFGIHIGQCPCKSNAMREGFIFVRITRLFLNNAVNLFL